MIANTFYDSLLRIHSGLIYVVQYINNSCIANLYSVGI